MSDSEKSGRTNMRLKVSRLYVYQRIKLYQDCWLDHLPFTYTLEGKRGQQKQS